jgi:tetratricopeptide (TPR) repeat protein/predicted aspartyl protease
MKMRSTSLALAMLASAALCGQARAAGCTLAKVAELPVTMAGLRPLIHTEINGADAMFILDSGAFFSTLTPSSAVKYGLRVGPAPTWLTVWGVGGKAKVSLATAKDFTFGDELHHNVEFLVDERGFGEDEAGLLGQNVLINDDVEYDLAKGVIRLFRPTGCNGAVLAYWAGSQPYSVINIEPTGDTAPHANAMATLNGASIKVDFDTGSPVSILSIAAAGRAGVKPSSPGVVSAGYSSGVGLGSYLQTSIAPFSSFKLGGEEIRNIKLRFGELRMGGDADMLIGADFFLSHHVYVSNNQHKIFFTYNGGPVFNVEAGPRPVAEAAKAAPASPSADADPDAPEDAAGLSRRAAAFSARRDFTHAIADLNRAIELAPSDPKYVYERGRAEAASGRPLLAMADYEQALKLKPDDIAVLLSRAGLHLAMQEPALVRSDLEAADRFAAKDPDARLDIAVLYDAADLNAESIAELDQWIAAHPKHDRLAAAMNERCWDRALLGRQLDLALADCNAALRLDPGNPGFLDSRGLVHLRLGDFDKSIADYQAALRLMPNSPWTLYGRGLARLRKGMKSEGEADIAAATAIRPGLPAEAKARGLAP